VPVVKLTKTQAGVEWLRLVTEGERAAQAEIVASTPATLWEQKPWALLLVNNRHCATAAGTAADRL
jgi:hypothetical protein